MTLRRMILTVCTLMAVGACADQAPVSGPGTMTVTLRTPNASEGAALVALLGEGIGTVTGAGNTQVWSEQGNSILQVVLINENGGDLMFQVAVPDTTNPPGWVVHEVAGPDDELRTVGSLYELEFRR
jgi:hypothetical protein